jgi:hypothetical protein
VNQAALVEQLRQSTSFLWLVLALVWVVSALRTKRTVQSQSSASQLLYTATGYTAHTDTQGHDRCDSAFAEI